LGRAYIIKRFWNLPVSTSKDNLLVKACWANIPYVCMLGGEHCSTCVRTPQANVYQSETRLSLRALFINTMQLA
jgi:hypothetical protein